MGRIYSAIFASITATQDQDLFAIQAPSDAVVKIHSVNISQDESETSLQVPFQIHRTSAFGSGGSTPTPSPFNVGDPAFGGTVHANDTTVATPGAILYRMGENVLAGFQWVPTPECQIVIPPSGIVCVSFMVEIASHELSGTIVFEEIG